MVRDDLEACLQAYQFAELLLGGFLDKNEKERDEALQAATRLRDDVEARYTAALSTDGAERLKAARARIDRRLDEARAVHPGE